MSKDKIKKELIRISDCITRMYDSNYQCQIHPLENGFQFCMYDVRNTNQTILNVPYVVIENPNGDYVCFYKRDKLESEEIHFDTISDKIFHYIEMVEGDYRDYHYLTIENPKEFFDKKDLICANVNLDKREVIVHGRSENKVEVLDWIRKEVDVILKMHTKDSLNYLHKSGFMVRTKK